MAIRPNNGNYFVWDIDGGAVVGWLVVDGKPAQLVAGRIGGKLRDPLQAPTFLYRKLDDGRDLLKPEFVAWTKERGAEYHFVEVAHVKPRRVSSAQSFSRDEINSYLTAAAAAGITVISPRFNSARHARSDMGYPYKDDERPKWYELTTDAAIMAEALMGREDFDNWTVLTPSITELDEARREYRAMLTDVRARVQALVNDYRFELQTPPTWATPADDVPWQVTRALAGILVVFPGMTWSMAKTAFELHGRTVSGRGRNSLLRSEVCHTSGSGPQGDFVYNFGWAWIKHEFLRLRASMRGEAFDVPRPPARSRIAPATVGPLELQASLFDDGRPEPPVGGSVQPNEEGVVSVRRPVTAEAAGDNRC